MTAELPETARTRSVNDDLPAVGTPARELTLDEALAIAQMRADDETVVEYIARARQRADVPREVRADE